MNNIDFKAFVDSLPDHKLLPIDYEKKMDEKLLSQDLECFNEYFVPKYLPLDFTKTIYETFKIMKKLNSRSKIKNKQYLLDL